MTGCRRNIVVAAIVLAASLSAGAQTPPFRSEANYIRVDMYASRDGKPVEDLQQAEVEVLDQGVRQRIDRFERIVARGSRTGPVRPDPVNFAEARAQAAEAGSRVFVLFLDTYHVDGNFSRRVSQPLINALDDLIGRDDLVAVMTSQMNVRDLTFTHRASSVEPMLRSAWWGKRDTVLYTPRENEWEACYPGLPDQLDDEGMAQEMILRRREAEVLAALDALVEHVGGIGESRKAVITISSGWRLFDDNEQLRKPLKVPVGDVPAIGVEPGRPGGVPPLIGGERASGDRSSGSRITVACEADRMALSRLRLEPLFLDTLNRANRMNVSFYPIDPRRVVVFDEDPLPAAGVGVNPMVGLTEDNARRRARQDALRTMAESTDGTAVVNASDLEGGLRRIGDDLSAYYLIGFLSTQNMDGKFHRLEVRVKRAGLQIRARRGYQAAKR